MPFDALVLLGCRVAAGALPAAAARRAARAADAFGAGLAPRVVVTGGRVWEGRVEADRLADELVTQGVPRESLLLERASRTTRDNAVLTARLLAPLGYVRIGLVSCDWHLARALWSFRREGFEAEPVAALSPPLGTHRRVGRALRERGAWLLDWARAR
ncbi:MAG TPA: YdcF family protein [Polyangiaceae bacterium]|nr:YdcF family protein [Polyangiaceae bacterium]